MESMMKGREFETELHREQKEFATRPEYAEADLAAEVRRW